MISDVQSGRLEDQRCSLPPSTSTPVTPIHNGTALNRSTGQPCIVLKLNFVSQRHFRNNIWLSITGADADAFFSRISSAQARRLDDQRVALPALPGISGSSESKGNTKVWICFYRSVTFTCGDKKGIVIQTVLMIKLTAFTVLQFMYATRILNHISA